MKAWSSWSRPRPWRAVKAYTGPIRMDLDIVLPIPQSSSGVRRRRAAAGEIAPTVKPDADNVEKAIKDGCNGVAYRDDAQVVQASKCKVYGVVPGVAVVLTVLGHGTRAGSEEKCGVKQGPLRALTTRSRWPT